ncbi:MAG: prolyl oligopeptidase family serine peptidase [Acidimicrobiia bacterium]|nr:prolyl oligopeptidase family serine peptidase [Acidimicrobiia bacterium]
MACWRVGQLALWASERGDLPPGTPGAEPVVEVAAVVALAPVTDLVGAGRSRTWATARCRRCSAGSRPMSPTSTMSRLPGPGFPYDAPVLLVHGTADEKVPVEQTLGFASAAEEAGDAFEVMILDGVGHFAAIDTDREVWPDVRGRIGELLDLAAEQRDGG